MLSKEIIKEFSQSIQDGYAQLNLITESESCQSSTPGKWSKKQIIGHLIDSAANNHQRFVRVQLENNLTLPGYQQEKWVTAQHYNEISWADLLTLWKLYNQHLLHIISRIPPEKLEHKFRIENNEEVILGYWVEDYLRHLQNHLRQILS